MTKFINPYQFVPLVEKVYYLSEEEKKQLQYVYDIPFSDGLSGEIKVTFRAETPFCVKGIDGNMMSYNGKYFVPGSSIKGMIRNVFAIFTCSDIANMINDDKYGFRDLHNEKYLVKRQENVKEGFLIRIKEKHYIKHYIIQAEAETWLFDEIKKLRIDILKFRYNKDICAKYRMLNRMLLNDKVIVISGPKKNKRGEKLFTFTPDSLKFEVSEQVFNNFIFINKTTVEKNVFEKSTWAYWENKLKTYDDFDKVEIDGIVPCYFREKNGEIIDFGLCRLYKQLYNKSIKDCLSYKLQKDELIDMTQAVFGYSNNKEKLRGRITFSNADVVMQGQLVNKKTALSSPKPTFCPFYLRAGTYNDESAKIAGWKRYVQQKNWIESSINENNRNETKFIPEGSYFTTMIRYFNLRPYELGALLCAIKPNEDSFHSIGYGKPLGYGRVSMSIDNMNEEYKSCRAVFITKMKKILPSHDIERIINKYFTVYPLENGIDIRYPKLLDKEFEKIRKKNRAVRNFPEIEI